MTDRGARVTAIAAAALGSLAALWLLWGPIFTASHRDQPLVRCMKNYFAADQFSVMAIARNVQDGHPLYTEPYSGSGSSVYPSGYYYVLGKTADATDTSVVWAWNIVGILVSLALIAISVWWARRLAPGTRAWILAPLPFLIGTLMWWDSRGWIYLHARSVLWPPFASLYSPGAEGPALALAAVGLLALALSLSAEHRAAPRWAALAGIAVGLSLHAHANVAVFAVVAATLILVFDYATALATRRRRALVAGGGLAMLLLAVLAPGSGFAPRIAALVLAAFVVLVSDRSWLRRRGTIGAILLVTTFLASLPISVDLASQALSSDSYFAAREQSVAKADTNVPLGALLLLLLPVWVLVVAVAFRLYRTPKAGPLPAGAVRPSPSWLSLLTGLATATVLLTLGGRLGAEGLEWHRFTIYGPFLCVMAAAPGLWLLLRYPRDRRERMIGIVAVLFVAASFPTAIAFVNDERDLVLCVPAEEVEAYAAIGQAAGRSRVLLLDRCLRPGDFKVYSGARIKYYNNGISAPPDKYAVDAVLTKVALGELPSDAQLRAVGVTSFLSHDHCGGIARDVLQQRFGPPNVEIPLRNAANFGFLTGLSYQLYDVPPSA